MIARRSIVAFAVGLLAVLGGARSATAGKPGECVTWDPFGAYCIEWTIDGHDGSPGDSGGGGGPAPICYWRNVGMIDDPTIFADYGLPYPPDGAVIQWQMWECSDGRVVDNWRWVFTVPPIDIAFGIRVRIAGRLGPPVVEASPPIGTPSILGVPVFVAVSNWTGVISESACGGGVCATVTATPSLNFSTGEPGGSTISCAGSGTKFDRSQPPSTQASAPGACAHVYKLRTAAEGRPAEWPGSVSVTWSISWTSTVGDSGVLPSITRTLALPRGVQEVQTVVVGGETP
jgi:hypothetical protein